MIVVKLNEADFEYDIYSLVKAFYPKEELIVSAEEKQPDLPVLFYMQVSFDGKKINISLHKLDREGKQLEAAYAKESIDVAEDDRKQRKNQLKILIYQMLSKQTNQQLPWGTLTGIRPTKIPVAFLEGGSSDAEIEEYMKQTYLTSQEKINLSIEIAKKELKLLSAFDYKNGYSLYIGIPFCPTTCLYCSFTSYPISMWKDQVDDYLDAVEKELKFAAKAFKNKPLQTIYMGGGTPTTLSAAQFERLFTSIEQLFDLSHLREFCVEGGRPDSITRDKLEVIKQHGVNRISINPQTMNQETLDLIGRRHTVEQIVESFYLAREVGFDNINMDMILGLPDEGEGQVRHTMEEITKLGPDSLTVHSLAIKRAARLRMEKEDYEKYNIRNTNEMMKMTAEYAKIMGMAPYYLYRQKNMAGNLENIGYSKPGKEGIYNILIMEEKQTILSVGAGGLTKYVSGDQRKRIENVKDVKNYMERIDEMIERKRAICKE